jgi:hypothetical protein
VKKNKDAVPTTLWFIWVGGEMPDAYAERIATAARDNPDWKVNVLLSSTFSASPEAFEANRTKVQNAGADPVLLEGELAGSLKREHMLEPLIWEWKLTAGSDDIVNYGALSDILRVHVLREHGGMYLDTDNTITTPLPTRIVPKYGFLYGVFGGRAFNAEKDGVDFDRDPSAYTRRWNDDDPATMIQKPATVTNSALVTVPNGKVINAYWDHIKGVYTPLASQPEDARIAALRWGPTSTTSAQRLEAMKLRTLHNTGPGALETTLGTLTIKGQNGRDLCKPAYAHDAHGTEAKQLMLDPKYVFVRSDNSWMKVINEGLGGAGPS